MPEDDHSNVSGRAVPQVMPLETGRRWLWLAGVAVIGLVALFAIPTWMVNFDGSGYLALAANLRDSLSYVAPDGSAMTARGPGYPAVLSSAWLVDGYPSGLAIAVSRVVLVGGGLVAALLAKHLTGSRIAGFVAGALVMTQPLLLPSGAAAFAPDGTAVAFGLLSILLLLLAVRDDSNVLPFVASGFFMSLVLITKESHLLALFGSGMWLLTRRVPLGLRLRQVGYVGLGFSVVFVLWIGYGINAVGHVPGALPHIEAPLAWAFVAFVPVASAMLIAGSRWVGAATLRLPVWLASFVTFVLAIAVTSGLGRALMEVGELPGALINVVSTQGYLGWTIVGAVLLVVLGVAGSVRVADPGAAALLWIVMSGLAGVLVHVLLTGAVIRNLLLLPVLLSVLAASTVAPRSSSRARRVVAYAGVITILVAGIVGMVRLSDAVDVDRLTAEASPTVAAAAWLDANANTDRTVGTPMYFQSAWRLGNRGRDVSLLPMYVMPMGRWENGARTFEVSYEWLGRAPSELRSADAVSYSFNDWGVGAVFAEDLVTTAQSSRFIVVAGNARYPASQADGGVVLLALQGASGVRPVFVESRSNAQWIVIFEFTDSLVLAQGAPLVRYSRDAPDGLERRRTLGLAEYASAVTEELNALEADVAASLSGS